MFNTLGEAIDFLKESVDRKGNIMLSTIHKAKGLEFDTVAILDVDLIKSNGQDPNVKYVAETRARHTLNYITSEGFTTTLEEKKAEAKVSTNGTGRGIICPHCNSEFSVDTNEGIAALASHAEQVSYEATRLRSAADELIAHL